MTQKKKSNLSQALCFYTAGDKTVVFISMLILIAFFVALVYPLVYSLISSFSKGVLPLNLIPKLVTT